MASLLEPLRPWTQPWDVPLLYEDEVKEEMGDHDLHSYNVDILGLGLEQFLAGADWRMFKNLNTYYRPPAEIQFVRRPCVAPDLMIAEAIAPRSHHPSSYDLDRDPTPRVLIEVLSDSTAEDNDLDKKPRVYSFLGVREYILIDTTGEILPERLLLKRLQPDGSWQDCQDPDGGVTSELGFRIVIDADGDLRVTDLQGKKFLRPREVSASEAQRQKAEERARKAEAKAKKAESKAKEAESKAKEAEKRARELELELKRIRKPPQS